MGGNAPPIATPVSVGKGGLGNGTGDASGLNVVPSSTALAGSLARWLVTGSTSGTLATGDDNRFPLGAVSSGVPSDGSDATSAIKAFIEGLNGKRGVFQAGSYSTAAKTVGSDYSQHPAAPAKLALAFTMDPATVFSGTGYLSLRNIIPYQGEIFSLDVVSRRYDAGDVGGLTGGNIFQRASYVEANIVGPAVVAYFGQGISTVDGGRAWGANMVGGASKGTGIGIEVNALGLGSTANAYGVVIHGAGFYPTTAAINIGSNSPESTFVDGITFNVLNVIRNGQTVQSPPFSGSLIKMPNANVTHGINLNAGIFSGSEWWSSNFLIGPTDASRTSFLRLDSNANISSRSVDGTSAAPITYAPANGGRHQFLVNGVQQLQVKGNATSTDYLTIEGGVAGVALNIGGSSADVNFSYFTKGVGKHQFLTGATSAQQFQISDSVGATDYVKVFGGAGDVTLTSGGASTNSSISIVGRGNGGGKMRDGAAAVKFQWNTTGVGFFAAAPVVRQTAPAALATDGSATNAAMATAINALRTALVNYGLAA